MNYVKLIAPAKINLVLAIGKRLPDGYHEAHTILHALSLHDTLEIRRTEPGYETDSAGLSITLTCDTTNTVEDLAIAPEDNIVFQAAMKLADALGRTEREEIRIALTKQIPHEAGLGGGSSDAAATLKGLACLWGIDLDDPVLVEVAASLGADVPFFLYGGCAYLNGRGDNFVHALEPRKGFLALVRPEGDGVSTGEAYRRFDESPEYPSPAFIEELTTYASASDVPLWNNLTPAAITIKPELQAVFDLLERSSEAQAMVLCGSGSAVAALCDDYESAAALSLAARKAGHYSRVTSFASLGAEVLKKY